MNARDFIIANGGKWPDEMVPVNIPAEVTRRTHESPVVLRLAEADRSPDFARVLRICSGGRDGEMCKEYIASGHTCKGCSSCGGASIRLRWASEQGCPQKRW